MHDSSPLSLLPGVRSSVPFSSCPGRVRGPLPASVDVVLGTIAKSFLTILSYRDRARAIAVCELRGPVCEASAEHVRAAQRLLALEARTRLVVGDCVHGIRASENRLGSLVARSGRGLFLPGEADVYV
jgi:hypothetical protein